MANIVVRGPTLTTALELAGDIAGRLGERARDGRFRVLGPAPAPYVKLRGEHRAQLFLKGSDRRAMRLAVRDALASIRGHEEESDGGYRPGVGALN